MPFFNKTVLSSERTAVLGEQVTYDLPVLPLSYVDLRLTSVAAALGSSPVLSDFLGYITNVEVLLRGRTIVGASLSDLAAYAAALTGDLPRQENPGGVASQRQSWGFRIPFGRRRFWTQEILPPFRRGELQLRLTYAAAFTRTATLIEHIETLEVPDATPVRYLKLSTQPKTPSAAGAHDVDLPLGNKILGVLLFGTTVPDGATETTSIDLLETLVDNTELFYPETRWEEIHADFMQRAGFDFGPYAQRGSVLSSDPASIAAGATGTATLTVPGARVGDHVQAHPRALLDGLVVESYDITAADTVTVVLFNPTAAAKDDTAQTWDYVLYSMAQVREFRQYAYLDFDPFKDPEMAYSLITAGRSRVHLRITADDTAAIRVLPVEVIEVAERAT